MAFLIGGANSAADVAYDIENSLRWNPGDSPKLARTPTSNGNADIWTCSAWIKRATGFDGDQLLLSFGEAGEDDTVIRIRGTGDAEVIGAYNIVSTTTIWRIDTAGSYRDPSAWLHIVLAVDTTEAAIVNGVKLYINGEANTYAGTSWTQNTDTAMNNTSFENVVGARQTDGAMEFDGYMADVYFIDGTQYAASDFGEFDGDSGIWKPKKFAGTFGTNGFKFEFKQSGTGTNSSGMGADTSGNDNHFAVTNLTATDQCTDSPTNNFAVYNAALGLGGTLAEGNCEYKTSDSYDNSNTAFSSIGINKGKWYAEFKVTASNVGNSVIGAGYDPDIQQDGRTNFCQEIDQGWGYSENGRWYNNSDNDDGFPTYTTGDIVGVELDLDGNKIYWYKDGTLLNSGGESIDADELYFFAVSDTTLGGETTVQANFGNPPFVISSGNADENGYGNFEYAPSSGYLALCTKNLAEEG